MPEHSGHSSPQKDNTDQEIPKEGGNSEGHEHGPHGHRMFYYHENKPPSCPVHGHSPGETHHKHQIGRAHV